MAQHRRADSESGDNRRNEAADTWGKCGAAVVDALQTIATLSVYGLFVGVNEAGDRSLLFNGRFNQAHVEFIQAVALRIPGREIRFTPPFPGDIQQLFNTLPELAEAYDLKRLGKPKRGQVLQSYIEFIASLRKAKGHTFTSQQSEPTRSILY
jgi:hypothetical protein